jgi:hypothetical protein
MPFAATFKAFVEPQTLGVEAATPLQASPETVSPMQVVAVFTVSIKAEYCTWIPVIGLLALFVTETTSNPAPEPDGTERAAVAVIRLELDPEESPPINPVTNA